MLFRQLSNGSILDNWYKFGIYGADLDGQYIETKCGIKHGYRPLDIENTLWYYQTFRLELIK